MMPIKPLLRCDFICVCNMPQLDYGPTRLFIPILSLLVEQTIKCRFTNDYQLRGLVRLIYDNW